MESKDNIRFGFGDNWLQFIDHLDDYRIQAATESLKTMFDVDSLRETTFLDIGSGSGLFSLAARKLNAEVTSFDLDPQSMRCAEFLRARYFPADTMWNLSQGSILDPNYVGTLGTFDIVYSWGVLHHTGSMWKAIENACTLVGPHGQLLVAIYNDQGFASKYWEFIKVLYNRHRWLQTPLKFMYAPYFVVVGGVVRMLRRSRKTSRTLRGMRPWTDMVDWLGGYPFEVATPDKVISFVNARGFELKKSELVGRGLGCNEFLFCNTSHSRGDDNSN